MPMNQSARITAGRLSLFSACLIVAFAGTTQTSPVVQPCRFLTFTFTSFHADAASYYSDGKVACFDEYTNPYQGQFTARSWVVNETTSVTVGEDTCASCPGRYGQTQWIAAVGGTTQAGNCYRAQLGGSSSFYSNGIGSALKCVPAPCADTNQNHICDNQEPIGPDPGEEACPGGRPCTSPLLINLATGAWQLSGTDDPVVFDIDADGAPNRITWTAPNSAIAFLAFDRNQNATIDDGSELFGNWTLLLSRIRARNGFEALKELDSNGDGVVDRLDDRWNALLLWTDLNHDAVSQPAELQSIAASAVEVLGTSYHWTGRRDSSGNYFGYQSLAQLAGTSRPFYDVYFRSVP